ncbi:MAG: DUF2304 domain-containing protein [Candidatus Woesebacteria bacterium]
MMLLQIISVVFGLFMMYVVRIHRRKNHLESFEYGVWMALWTIFITLAIFPESVNGVVQTLHIARVFDLLVVAALMIVIFLTFTNRIEQKKLEKKMEQIVRKKAIDNAIESPKK